MTNRRPGRHNQEGRPLVRRDDDGWQIKAWVCFAAPLLAAL